MKNDLSQLIYHLFLVGILSSSIATASYYLYNKYGPSISSGKKKHETKETKPSKITTIVDTVETEEQLNHCVTLVTAIFNRNGLDVWPNISCEFNEVSPIIKYANANDRHKVCFPQDNIDDIVFEPNEMLKYPKSLIKHQDQIYKSIRFHTHSMEIQNGKFYILIRRNILAKYVIQTYATIKSRIIQIKFPESWRKFSINIHAETYDVQPHWVGTSIVGEIERSLAESL